MIGEFAASFVMVKCATPPTPGVTAATGTESTPLASEIAPIGTHDVPGATDTPLTDTATVEVGSDDTIQFGVPAIIDPLELPFARSSDDVAGHRPPVVRSAVVIAGIDTPP
jgi:hypothetical protein